MTIANGAGAVPAEASARWPRLLLIIAAAIELIGGLRDLPILLGDLSQVPGLDFGGAVNIAKIVLQPILAFLALALAIRRRMMDALLAMAAIIALTWLSFLPSVAIQGLGLTAGGIGFTAALLVFQVFLAPAIALAVALLALARHWTPACVLAVVPTFIGVACVVAFAVDVAIHGFEARRMPARRSPPHGGRMDPFLAAAIAEARQGLAEGGIPIGSVLVIDGMIVGRGHNRRVQKGSAILHAEMDASRTRGACTPPTIAARRSTRRCRRATCAQARRCSTRSRGSSSARTARFAGPRTTCANAASS